jgi:hypothetical protein
MMNARKYFQYVVVPSYGDFVRRPTEYRLLENALLLMDTVPERLALHQLGNPELSRETLYWEAQKIRGQHNSLSDLRSCASALKYGRSIRDYSGGKFTTIATPTALTPMTEPHGRSADTILYK